QLDRAATARRSYADRAEVKTGRAEGDARPEAGSAELHGVGTARGVILDRQRSVARAAGLRRKRDRDDTVGRWCERRGARTGRIVAAGVHGADVEGVGSGIGDGD